VLFSAGTQAAYAVARNEDGTVSVEVDSMTDAPGLQAALQAAGVNAVVEYLPVGKDVPAALVRAGRRGRRNAAERGGRTSDGATRFTISGDRPARRRARDYDADRARRRAGPWHRLGRG
jgi:hypothetical protein